jgi:hypothetical protein
MRVVEHTNGHVQSLEGRDGELCGRDYLRERVEQAENEVGDALADEE